MPETRPPRANFWEDVRAGVPWPTWAFPGIVALLLSIPCVGLTYLWDDYAFLNNAFRSRLWDFLPDPHDSFYRPLSRGVYFYILFAARNHGALLGHIINVATLAAIACLVGAAGTRLGGKRVGICSGVLFAGLACVPTLVAWTCCSQDLLAMLFVMLAVHFRLSDRPWPALACIALGIACKETTIVAIPAILALGWIRERPTLNLRREVVSYLALIVAWAAIHPAIKILVARAFQPGRTGYVGLASWMDILKHAGIYALEVLNLRIGKIDLTWSWWQVALLVVSVLGTVAITWFLLESKKPGTPDGATRQVVRLGAALAIGPWLLTSAIILGYSQYYAAFPGMGASLILGAGLARLNRGVIAGVLGVFLILGLWSRSTDMKNAFLTESDLRLSSAAHKELWRTLLHLEPSFPRDSQLLISVQAHGRKRVYHQVYNYQMPALWYWDPSLVIRKPEDRKADGRPEFLLAVSNDLDVVRINPTTFETATSSGRPADYLTVEQALRTYSMGLAASGETDAAARLLVEMPEVDASYESFHHRMAVMYLLADGREEDAKRLEAGIPPATRTWALDNLPAILAQQPATRTFDSAGLQAFGIDSTDVDAIRHLTGWYLRWRYAFPGARFAERLLRLAPGDSTALAALAVRDSVVTARARARIGED